MGIRYMPRAYTLIHYFGSAFVQACIFLSIKKCKAKFFRDIKRGFYRGITEFQQGSFDTYNAPMLNQVTFFCCLHVFYSSKCSRGGSESRGWEMVKMVDKRNCLSKVVRQRGRVRFVKFIFQKLWDNQSYLFIHYENIPLTHKISNYFQSIVIYKYYTLALSEFAKIVQKARGKFQNQRQGTLI